VAVYGWAIDPQTSDPIAVHVYVNGVLRGGCVAESISHRRMARCIRHPATGTATR
jgi:hypothetical protein